MIKLKRYVNNPILNPIPEHDWEAKAVFNTAAIYLDNQVHLVYRAMSHDNISTFGYASSDDGINIDTRLAEPIYVPRIEEEKTKNPGGNSGCEDPRITQIGDTLYMCYTAFDGVNPTRVALTTISVEDFLNHNWNWAVPKIITPPGIDSKNACVLPEIINGKYYIFHRFYPCIWIDAVDDLNFGENDWVKGSAWIKPRSDKWDSRKIGIAGPPIKTDHGWLLIYHAITESDRHYRLGAILLKLDNPTQTLARTDYYLFEPRLEFELDGQEDDVVFSCGSVVIDDNLYVYYGGADKSIGIATCNFTELVNDLIP